MKKRGELPTDQSESNAPTTTTTKGSGSLDYIKAAKHNQGVNES